MAVSLASSRRPAALFFLNKILYLFSRLPLYTRSWHFGIVTAAAAAAVLLVDDVDTHEGRQGRGMPGVLEEAGVRARFQRRPHSPGDVQPGHQVHHGGRQPRRNGGGVGDDGGAYAYARISDTLTLSTSGTCAPQCRRVFSLLHCLLLCLVGRNIYYHEEDVPALAEVLLSFYRRTAQSGTPADHVQSMSPVVCSTGYILSGLEKWIELLIPIPIYPGRECSTR